MRGSHKIRFAAIPILVALGAIAAGCGSSGSDAVATTTAAPTTTTSATTTSATASPSATTAALSPDASAATPAPQSQDQGARQDADATRPHVEVGAPCTSLYEIGNDSLTGEELVCEFGTDVPVWTELSDVKIRAVGEPCEPKLEAVAWSTAGVELMCVDQEWVLLD